LKYQDFSPEKSFFVFSKQSNKKEERKIMNSLSKQRENYTFLIEKFRFSKKEESMNFSDNPKIRGKFRKNSLKEIIKIMKIQRSDEI